MALVATWDGQRLADRLVGAPGARLTWPGARVRWPVVGPPAARRLPGSAPTRVARGVTPLAPPARGVPNALVSEDRPAGAGETPLDSTAILLQRFREGDERARDRLFERYLPILQHWAHGRLPGHARGMADTGDLVQVCLLRALGRLYEFDVRREGAFLAYLRRSLMNAVRDQIRRAAVRSPVELDAQPLAAQTPSPIEDAIGRETIEHYETALESLSAEQQEAIIMRLEFGYDWAQIADALGKPSPASARMLAARALARLAEAMDAHRP